MPYRFFLVKNVTNKRGRVIKAIQQTPDLNPFEKAVLNLLQKDFGFSLSPFTELAAKLETDETRLIATIEDLKARGFITRIGPFFNMDRSSGYVSLVAMKVDELHFAAVAEMVNSFTEVAHNYKRQHELNMWFVLAAHSEAEAMDVLQSIENKTGLKTYNLPKLQEFNLDLYLEVL